MQHFNQRRSARYDISGPHFFFFAPVRSGRDLILYLTVGNRTYRSYATDRLKSHNYWRGFFFPGMQMSNLSEDRHVAAVADGH